ncbi:MAG TPA: hypothetical protein ENK44_06215 [Caldithrix abyssi]|uniref:Histidine kinase domain-containing protein n=1 Tax=Caldithrix abyssi TaxID=187145 RepID=A0A7V4U0Y8_CALAY|nr:hypothetical protein [Caldithrix abyssi]
MAFIKKIILAIFVFGAVLAQDIVPEFERITEDDGLLNTTVECIFQDSFGFMWFGTWKGLTRYDGTDFRFYKIFPAHPRFVSSNNVTALAEDKNGFIWIGTMQGLIRLDPFNGATRTYRHDALNPNSPSHDFITSLFVDKETIWFGTQGGGLNKLALNTGGEPIHFFHYTFDSGSYAKSGWNSLYGLIGDQRLDKDLLWIATAEGLIRFEKKSGKYDRLSHQAKSPASDELKVIHQDKRKRIWVGTANGFISLLSEKATGAITFYDYAVSANRMINHISDADSTHLWLDAGNEGGLIRFNTDSGEYTNFLNDPSIPNSLINNFITALYQDCSGILWVGTANSLSRFDPGRKKFRQSVALPAMHKKYYHSRKTPEILKSGKDKLWLGKYGFGLIYINSANNNIINYRHDETDPQSLCNDFIQVMLEDHLGTIWVGTQNGLDRFEEKNGTFIHYSDDPQQAGATRFLPDDLINDIYEDRDGRLWVCTSAGVSRLDRSKDHFVHYLYGSSRQLRKTGYYLGTVYQDSKKQYWIGGRGLFRFYPEENKIKPYFHQQAGTLLWINEMVSTIYEDRRGSLWIGTSGAGLYRLSEHGPSLQLTENNGFAGDYVMAILEDKQGFLWVSTYMGLSKVDPVSGTFKNYGLKDGLTYNYFQLRSASKDKYDRMYFGQNSGYTEFDPSRIKDNPNESQIIITGISIFNQDINPEIPAKGYSQLILPYNQNMLTFKYVLLNFTNSRLNNYKYLLNGVDKEWNYVGRRRVAAYSNLPAGEYIFQVKGRNSDGVWNEQGAAVKIIILPPWWRTWWAYALYFILTAAVLFGGFRFETNRRVMEHRAVVAELQAETFEARKHAEQEQMRGRIAGDLHDDIGSNLSSIVLLSETLEHRLKPTGKEKQRLKQIRQIAMATAESMRDIVWFVNPLNDDMDKLLAKMRETANTMLSQVKLRVDIERSKDSGWQGDLNFRRNLFLLFKEALQNIVRHSRATEVVISIRQNKQMFRLEIQDNGIGFEAKTQYAGNGLKNFKHRAKEMKAEYVLTTQQGAGTSVLLIKNIP